ncbi:putative serine/threonine-protein kinase [Phytophthora citrophthora]|uniref:Serine/threonine-protein kinase n=1 Tax=Phytophthora citrophthora TaxID=4793 RepID=A0AAD9LB62_9STRA|nr:putative serine/threonine-protein kinase [Phytophthora citrophthora]
MIAMDVIETDRADVQVNSAGATSYVNNYKIVNMLGEGTFSKVYLCHNEAGNEFALKVINKSILKRKREYKRVDGKLVLSNAFQKVQKEVAIMKKLAHSNLVKLYEVIDSPDDDKLFLVLELIRGGQIMHWDDKKFRYFAKGSDSGVLSKETVRECLRDVVAALAFLHRNHICHRDIKPENILLSGDQYKVADFGVAHMNENDSSVGDATALKLRSTEGTYHFLAPECTTGDEYDPYQVDVWAVGVTMFTLLLGTLPFGTSVASLSDVMTSIREDALVLPSDLDPECAALLTQLLEKNPRLRITISQLQDHPWLSGNGELPQRSSGMKVMVTQQEIEAAFTPVNNFILVMKLKLKMSSRLNHARKALASNTVPVSKHVPAENGDTGQKTEEIAPGEQPQATSDKLQRHSIRVEETVSETVGALIRRKSQLGITGPVVEGPVPSKDYPGRDTTNEDIENVSSSRNDIDAPKSASSLKGDVSPANLNTEKAANILRLTKRKSTSYRGLVRAIEIPEGGDKPEATSPINRKKRRESVPSKRDSSSDLSLQSAIGTITSESTDNEAAGDSNARPSLMRKNSMSFRALVGSKPSTDTDVQGLSSVVQGDVSTSQTDASITVPTTRPAVISRRFSRRSSRSIRALNTSPRPPPLNESRIDGTLTTDSEPTESSTNSSPLRPASQHSRGSSLLFRTLVPMPVSEASPEISTTACNSPSKVELGSSSLTRRQSRCNSTTGDTPDTVQDVKDTVRLLVGGDLSPIKVNELDTGALPDPLPSPRLKSVPHSPTKAKVHDLNKDQHLGPLKTANLPVLDLNLSPNSSPLAPPVASPTKATNSSDEDEQTRERRSSSPIKAVDETHLESLKIAPLARKRSSSLKGFSSDSDEETLPKSASSSAIVTRAATASISSTTVSDRRFTYSAKPTSPLESTGNLQSPSRRLQRNRSMNAVENDDPSNTLMRKTSLAKVLDACMPPRTDQNVEEAKEPPAVDTEPPSTPIRRHVHVPPLIRPENQPAQQTTSSHGRHQISPLRSIASMDSPSLVIDSASKEPPPLEKAHSRRKSLALAQDSMRILFRGKSSVRLNLLEEKRGANYVSNDKVSTIASKVCGIM